MYDIETDRRRFAKVREAFAADRIASLPRSTCESNRPVFIVGMPRCGSTLIERILDAHPRVHGVGENEVVHGLAYGASTPFPELVDELNADGLDQMSGRLLESFERLDADADRIVDKSLGNFWFLGLLALVLRSRDIGSPPTPNQQNATIHLSGMSISHQSAMKRIFG